MMPDASQRRPWGRHAAVERSGASPRPRGAHRCAQQAAQPWNGVLLVPQLRTPALVRTGRGGDRAGIVAPGHDAQTTSRRTVVRDEVAGATAPDADRLDCRRVHAAHGGPGHVSRDRPACEWALRDGDNADGATRRRGPRGGPLRQRSSRRSVRASRTAAQTVARTVAPSRSASPWDSRPVWSALETYRCRGCRPRPRRR